MPFRAARDRDHLRCDDAGFGVFNSSYTACRAARQLPRILACSYSGIMLGINALFYGLFVTLFYRQRHQIKGLSQFMPRLFAGLAASCSPIYLGVILVNVSADNLLYSAVANWWVQIANGAAWLACGLWLRGEHIATGLLSSRSDSRLHGQHQFDVFLSVSAAEVEPATSGLRVSL